MSNPVADSDLKETDFDLNTMINATQSLTNDLTNHTPKKKRNRKKKKKKNAKKKMESEIADGQRETGEDKLNSILVGIEEYLHDNDTENNSIPVNIVPNQPSNGSNTITIGTNETIDASESSDKEIEDSNITTDDLKIKSTVDKPENETDYGTTKKNQTKDKLEDSEGLSNIDTVDPLPVANKSDMVYDNVEEQFEQNLTTIEHNNEDIDDPSVGDISSMDNHNEIEQDPSVERVDTAIEKSDNDNDDLVVVSIDITNEEDKSNEDPAIENLGDIDDNTETKPHEISNNNNEDPDVGDISALDETKEVTADPEVQDISILDERNKIIADPEVQDISVLDEPKDVTADPEVQEVSILDEQNKEEQDSGIDNIIINDNKTDREEDPENNHISTVEETTYNAKDPELDDINALEEPTEATKDPELLGIDTLEESIESIKDPKLYNINALEDPNEAPKDPKLDGINALDESIEDIEDENKNDMGLKKIAINELSNRANSDNGTSKDLQSSNKKDAPKSTVVEDSVEKEDNAEEEEEEEGQIYSVETGMKTFKVQTESIPGTVEDREISNETNEVENQNPLNDSASEISSTGKEEILDVEETASEKSHSVSVPVSDEIPEAHQRKNVTVEDDEEEIVVNLKHDIENEETLNSGDKIEPIEMDDIDVPEEDQHTEKPLTKEIESDNVNSKDDKYEEEPFEKVGDPRNDDSTESELDNDVPVTEAVKEETKIDEEGSSGVKDSAVSEENEDVPIETDVTEDRTSETEETNSDNKRVKDDNIKNKTVLDTELDEKINRPAETEETETNNLPEKEDDPIAELNLDPTEETTGLDIGGEETTGLDISGEEPPEKEVQVTDGKFTKKSLDDIFAETDAFLKELEFVDDSELNNLLNPSSNSKSTKTTSGTVTTSSENTISKSDIRKLYENEPIYIYTSLAGGGFHMIPRTNRLATILQANQIEFTYRDLGTDDKARTVWKMHGKGRTLPGVVRGANDIIGNWEEIDDLNEDYKVREAIYETL